MADLSEELSLAAFGSTEDDGDPVLATQDICSQKRCLKGVVVVVKWALFERMAHVASTGCVTKVLDGWDTHATAARIHCLLQLLI